MFFVVYYFCFFCLFHSDPEQENAEPEGFIGAGRIEGVSSQFAEKYVLPYLSSEEGRFSPGGEVTTFKFKLIKDILFSKKGLCTRSNNCELDDLELLPSETYYQWKGGELYLKYTYKNKVKPGVFLDNDYYPSMLIDAPQIVMLFTELTVKDKEVFVTYPTSFVGELSKSEITKYLSLFFNSSIRSLIDYSKRECEKKELDKYIFEVNHER